MRPIIDYLPTAESPPLAPKHITAAPTRNPDKHKEKKAKLDSNNSNATASSSSQAQRGGASHAPRLSNVSSTAHERAEAAALAKERERGNSSAQGDIDMEDDGDALSDGSDALSNSPSAESSSSRTPSPMLGSDEPEEEEVGQKRKFRDEYDHRSTSQQQQQQQRRGGSIGGGGEDYRAAAYHNLPPENYAPERYEETILDYFISETSQIPSILINPPADFDPNVAIDDDGHTALHWACAMGRIRVVKLLLAAGADIFRVNHSEQTALMRSVMFSNNYDVRKFPELYELLHRSTLNIDKSNRTVFHHIADVALSKGKTHAARYYMEAILSRLADYPKELGDVINFQDEEGETAITLAARARTKRLVKALLDHGADPKLRNRDGKSAEDYILEDERFRSSPTLGGGGAGGVTGLGNPSAVIVDRGIVGGSSATSYTGTNGYTSQAQQPGGASSTSTVAATGFPLPPRDAPKIFLSDAAQQAAGRATTELSHLLSSLARSFDTELQAKDRDVSQANSLLNKIQLEIGETKRSLEGLKTKLGERLDQGRARLEGLERELEEKMNGQYAAGWERYQASAEGRVAAAEGDDVSEQEKDRLRASVESGAEKREGLVKEYIKLRAEMGTGEEMSKYRRLIRAAAGTAEGEGDLDEIVAGLLEVRPHWLSLYALSLTRALPTPRPSRLRTLKHRLCQKDLSLLCRSRSTPRPPLPPSLLLLLLLLLLSLLLLPSHLQRLPRPLRRLPLLWNSCPPPRLPPVRFLPTWPPLSLLRHRLLHPPMSLLPSRPQRRQRHLPQRPWPLLLSLLWRPRHISPLPLAHSPSRALSLLPRPPHEFLSLPLASLQHPSVFPSPSTFLISGPFLFRFLLSSFLSVSLASSLSSSLRNLYLRSRSYGTFCRFLFAWARGPLCNESSILHFSVHGSDLPMLAHGGPPPGLIGENE